MKLKLPWRARRLQRTRDAFQRVFSGADGEFVLAVLIDAAKYDQDPFDDDNERITCRNLGAQAIVRIIVNNINITDAEIARLIQETDDVDQEEIDREAA